jgi:hypothetical protein
MVILIATLAGCQHQEPVVRERQESVKLETLPVGMTTIRFQGIYSITECRRYQAAEGFAKREESDKSVYLDGAVSLAIHAVPYGFRLVIGNPRPETLTLVGQRCGLIDIDGVYHRIDLRYTSTLVPEETSPQAITIAPHTVLQIDLDVVTPEHRDILFLPGEDKVDRESLFVDEGELPVFCSGWVLRQDQLEHAHDITKWSVGRDFGVHVEFSGDEKNYSYTFTVTPADLEWNPRETEKGTDARPQNSVAR